MAGDFEVIDERFRYDAVLVDENHAAALDRLERLYLDELNATADASEGIAAFLEKRTPSWTHS